jgi:hypothetical protein
MLIRRLAVLIAGAACGSALFTASASAVVFLRVDPAGTALPADSLVRNNGTAHTTVLGGGIQCFSSTISITVGASGGAAVTGTVKSWTFQNCLDAVPGLTVTSCSQAPTTTAHVAFSLSELNFDQFWLKCTGDPAGSACYYRAHTATGPYQGGAGVGLGAYLPPPFGGGLGPTLTRSAPTGVTDDTGAACGTDGHMSSALTRLVGGTPTTALTVTSS